MSSIDQNAQPDVWPAGVHTRFRAIEGAFVDVRGSGNNCSYRCLGCDEGAGIGNYSDRQARERANSHAEKCRALPRPTA